MEGRQGKEAREEGEEALPTLARRWEGGGEHWCFSCSLCSVGSLFGRDKEATLLQG